MITFLIGGIWHGAAWTFVFWGFLHGSALVIHRVWAGLGLRMWSWSAWLITFIFINTTWVFFRAKEWDDAIKVLSGMVDIKSIVSAQPVSAANQALADSKVLIWIAVMLLVVTTFKNSYEITSYPHLEKSKVLTKSYSIYFSLLFMFSILYISLSTYTEFIYFNF